MAFEKRNGVAAHPQIPISLHGIWGDARKKNGVRGRRG